MMHPPRSSLTRYLKQLRSRGTITFTREEALVALGLSEGTFLQAAAPLQRQGVLLSPLEGFYILVPTQFHPWGAPPACWYIDALMRGRPYYVALLEAAALHGASHQAVMCFQVITDRRMSPIRAGRSWISFHVRSHLDALRQGILVHRTEMGSMSISCPELTALDLLRYPHAVGGVDTLCTVLQELGDKIQGGRLATLSEHFARAHVQRLGYLLDWLGFHEPAAVLHHRVQASWPPPWVSLEPLSRTGHHAPRTLHERNARWRVLVHRPPQPD